MADDEQMSKCLIPMGITNENVANEFNIPREKQDAFAAKSYSKAEKAISSGAFKDEILPIRSIIRSPDGSEKKSLSIPTKVQERVLTLLP